MIRCTFHLNGGSFSILSCPGIGFFPAYSGNVGPHRNNPDSVMIENVGPLPPGKYYIAERGQGGFVTQSLDYFATKWSKSDRSEWFSLYRDDGQVDDFTMVDNVERKFFRLHPAGKNGISQGCITLVSPNHFALLRDALMKTAKTRISATVTALGVIQVF